MIENKIVVVVVVVAVEVIVVVVAAAVVLMVLVVLNPAVYIQSIRSKTANCKFISGKKRRQKHQVMQHVLPKILCIHAKKILKKRMCFILNRATRTTFGQLGSHAGPTRTTFGQLGSHAGLNPETVCR